MNKKLYLTALILLFYGTFGTSSLSFAEDLVKSGKISCGVAPFFRTGVNEYHDNSVVLRNVNDVTTITIDRVQAWNHNGELQWDSLTDGFPANPAFVSVIGPHQGSRFFASEVLGQLPVAGNLGQIAIEYSLDKRGHRLGAASTHFARDGGLSGAERSRQIVKCRQL